MIRTKSSNDYSLCQVILQLIGTICWSIYIFTSSQSTIVYIGTIIDMVLVALISGLIFAFYNFRKESKQTQTDINKNMINESPTANIK